MTSSITLGHSISFVKIGQFEYESRANISINTIWEEEKKKGFVRYREVCGGEAAGVLSWGMRVSHPPLPTSVTHLHTHTHQIDLVNSGI